MTLITPGYRMIHSVEIRNFRCFKELSIDHCDRFNVIVGDNGVGKTALLEAIFMALATSPNVALRYRAQRGLDSAFGGALWTIEEAMWRDLFYQGNWDDRVSVQLKGERQETRSVVISRGPSPEIPFSAAEQPESRLAGIQFHWENAAGKDFPFTPKISPTGVSYGDTEEEFMPDFFYFAANQTVTAGENAGRFSELSRSGRVPNFIEAVRGIYPWIVNLNIEIVAQLPVIYATLNTGEQYPLGMISGGINRIISIMLAIAARKRTVILIDEIEDGIYFKHQPKMWSDIAKIARDQESQLFVTTHNEEWLQAVFENDSVDDIGLWHLSRQEKGSSPNFRRRSGKQISIAVEGSGEIR